MQNDFRYPGFVRGFLIHEDRLKGGSSWGHMLSLHVRPEAESSPRMELGPKAVAPQRVHIGAPASRLQTLFGPDHTSPPLGLPVARARRACFHASLGRDQAVTTRRSYVPNLNTSISALWPSRSTCRQVFSLHDMRRRAALMNAVLMLLAQLRLASLSFCWTANF
jgi:hypothetical protein